MYVCTRALLHHAGKHAIIYRSSLGCWRAVILFIYIEVLSHSMLCCSYSLLAKIDQ